VPHGTIHADEANGMCFSTPFGNIIFLSYALRHFLYYMNVFFFGRQYGIKEGDILYSLLLAVRIMMGKESLDFELDPRGRLPKSIRRKIDELTDWQMLFVIGHEYAHHYLGHLESSGALKSNERIFDISDKINQFTYSQKCEFDADLNSITQYNGPVGELDTLLNGGFWFFLFIELYERVEDYLFPKGSHPRTHPKPLERIRMLRANTDQSYGMSKNQLEKIIEDNDYFAQWFLREFLPFNVETIEMSGSIYLPSYRKKVLIDRLDF